MFVRFHCESRHGGVRNDYLIKPFTTEMKLVTVNQPILNTIAAPVSPAAQPAHRP